MVFTILGFIQIHGQDIYPTSLFSLSNNTLGLSVNAPDGGNIAFDVPRSLLDSKDGTKDIPFRILIDGKQSEYSENVEVITTGNASDTFRSLNFYVTESTKTISIVGTKSMM